MSQRRHTLMPALTHELDTQLGSNVCMNRARAQVSCAPWIFTPPTTTHAFHRQTFWPGSGAEKHWPALTATAASMALSLHCCVRACAHAHARTTAAAAAAAAAAPTCKHKHPQEEDNHRTCTDRMTDRQKDRQAHNHAHKHTPSHVGVSPCTWP